MESDGQGNRYASENVSSVFREPNYDEEGANGGAESMDFDLNFGLASPLKDASTFNYDDPLLYQNVHIPGHSLQRNEAALNAETGANPGAWNDAQWDIPGAFKQNSEDNMDLDGSPCFDPSAYYEAQPGVADFGARDVKVYDKFEFAVTSPKDTYNGVFAPADNVDDLEMPHMLNPDVAYSYISEDVSPQHEPSSRKYESFQASVQPSFHSLHSFQPETLNEMATTDVSPDSDPRDSLYNSQTTFHAHSPRNLRLDSDIKDDASHRTSISAAINDLSPLTTTTSFTPSATSLHSTQPSFFSAQQFMRTSIDQPPSSLGRGSMDFYSLRRPSMESVNSGPNVPVRSQRSLASYFHFRDRDRDRERDRKSPMSGEQSPVPADWPPRHSIRSIFKTSNNGVGPEEESFLVDDNAVSAPLVDHTFEEGIPDMEDAAPKKSKRSKRNLFTRFKGTKEIKLEKSEKSENLEKLESEKVEDGVRLDSFSDTDLKEERYPEIKPQSKGTSSLHNMDSAGSSQEPDYASLFKEVGKRRNLVGMKSKKKESSKTDAGAKSENESDRMFLTASVSSAENSTDCVSAGSVPHSVHSFTSKDSVPPETAPQSGSSAFSNASKRILGARLMKKKTFGRTEPMPSDVVEVDLQSLDLPENTEILSAPSLLSKTRGRKEDKVADMEDQSKIFVCGYCDRRFKRQEHLKRHFRSLHTTQKPYDCPICSKKFSRTDNLAQHLKVHKQEEEDAAREAGTFVES